MTAYYNEFDAYAAQWLRNLSGSGRIMPGDVDERDIREVHPVDLLGYERVHFFAGIAGWDYALQLAGWPADREVWTGSCPCQPFSVAGKRKGILDERHLWPEFRRLIGELRPATIFGEQVASSDGRKWLAGIRADLENLGYAVGATDMCAASVGAPHIRQRLFWVAHSDMQREPEQGRGETHGRATSNGIVGSSTTGRLEHPEGKQVGIPGQPRGQRDADSERMEHAESNGREQRQSESIGRESISGRAWSDFDIVHCADGKARRIESGSFPLANGVPGRVGRLRAYGNAIVPQVAARFIKVAMEYIL